MFIIAKAGTGKTTTLTKLAELVKDREVLYLVYNKKNEEEAKQKFPNATVKTANAFCGDIVKNLYKPGGQWRRKNKETGRYEMVEKLGKYNFDKDINVIKNKFKFNNLNEKE